ncbi:MAG: PDZ domain-containing protein [Bacteroidetes bacterium]|nr:PDZ domain-containing protein [Bacteroidota bacterium]
MKRHFLSPVCMLAMLVFAGQSMLQAQGTTTPAPQSSSNIIVIQKVKNDDGTVTIKKKSIQKGQDAETYIEALDLENAGEKNVEVTIFTDNEPQQITTDGETIMMIRQGNHKTEFKWNGDEGMPGLPGLHNGQFALIGDEFDEKKAFLGVYPESNENGGVLLTGIVSGTGAEAAGLKAGDVLTAIDGENLIAQNDLTAQLAKRQPGDVVNITYLRDGQSLTTTAELTGRKAEKFAYWYSEERDPCEVFIGVQIGSWGDAEKGVGVSGIIPGWPAEAAGLQAGDRITALDGVPVNTHNELVIERDKHKSGEFFTINYLRNGQPGEVEAQFKVCPKDEVAPPVVEEQVVETPKPAVQLIDNTLQLQELNAYPNPTLGDLNVTFRGEAMPTTVTITDVNGKVVHNESLPNFDGYYNRDLNVSKGAPGTLLLTIRQDGKVVTTPVILLNRA